MPTLQNGQTYSNNLLAVCRQIVLSVFDHFVGLTLMVRFPVNNEVCILKCGAYYGPELTSYNDKVIVI